MANVFVLRAQNDQQSLFQNCSLKSCDDESKIHKYPQFLIIGDKKCGTDALRSASDGKTSDTPRYLGISRYFLSESHPELDAFGTVVGSGMETHFFDDGGKYRRGYEYYWNITHKICECQIAFEKTPAYFRVAYVPKHVKNFETTFSKSYGNKPLKFILILRNPVERLVSDYHFMFGRKETFARSLRKYLFLGSGKPNLKKIWPDRYYASMARWLQYYPLNRFLILDGDNFILHPAAEIAKIERFLNLPRLVENGLTKIEKNSQKGFYCINNKCLDKGKGHHFKPNELTEVEWTLLYDLHKPWNKKFCDLVHINFTWCFIRS